MWCVIYAPSSISSESKKLKVYNIIIKVIFNINKLIIVGKILCGVPSLTVCAKILIYYS